MSDGCIPELCYVALQNGVLQVLCFPVGESGDRDLSSHWSEESEEGTRQ